MEATTAPTMTKTPNVDTSESRIESYLDRYRELSDDTSRSPGRLAALRAEALDQFAGQGFPGRSEEEWRFTPLKPITHTSFAPAELDAEVDGAALRRYFYEGSCNLVCVNGVFRSDLSDPLEGGFELANLRGSLGGGGESASEWLVDRLGTLAVSERSPFVALNTALSVDAVALVLPRGVVAEKPVHVINVSTGDVDAVAHPRLLISAGENAQGAVIETYASLGGAKVFTNAVTEIECATSSVLRHYKVQRESLETAHMATMQVRIERAANFSSHSISHGGGLVRNDTNALLDGEGCVGTLNGLYVVAGKQHVDNHMFVEHKSPNTDSHELYKGILSDRSRAVFNGRIYVHKPAQKTDAKQSNRNLLLSEGAMVNSNPQLEIFADDVRCTHGSTIGQLDPDSLFYLRSRGMEEKAARSLLTYAFASEFVELVESDALRKDLQEFLFSRLEGGDIVRQAV